MIVKCIVDNLCDSITLNKEYVVMENAPDYYVLLDNNKEEIICRKSNFKVIEDDDLVKKSKAVMTELNYQIEKDCPDIKDFIIRKNSKGEIKEISIKFNYNTMK